MARFSFKEYAKKVKKTAAEKRANIAHPSTYPVSPPKDTSTEVMPESEVVIETTLPSPPFAEREAELEEKEEDPFPPITRRNFYKHPITWLKQQSAKFNTLAKIGTLLLPFLILGYIGVKIYDASKYTGDYTIDFSQNNFKNTKQPLYINEDSGSLKFSKFEIANGATIAFLQGTPLALTFKPTEFPLNKIIIFSITFKNIDSWEIELEKNPNDSEQKNWEILYTDLLEKYHFVKEFNGVYIYALTNITLQDSDKIETWLNTNIQSSTTVKILNDAIAPNSLNNHVQNKPGNDPDILITDFYYHRRADGLIKVEKKYYQKEFSKALAQKILNFNIRNESLSNNFRNLDQLNKNGYSLLSKYESYSLYGNKNIADGNTAPTTTSLQSWLKELLPKNSILQIPHELNLNTSDISSDIKNPILLSTDNSYNPNYQYKLINNDNELTGYVENISIKITNN